MTPFKRNDEIWGFTVSFLKDGTPAADIRVAFDEEITQKHDWIGRGAGLLPRECSLARSVLHDEQQATACCVQRPLLARPAPCAALRALQTACR